MNPTRVVVVALWAASLPAGAWAAGDGVRPSVGAAAPVVVPPTAQAPAALEGPPRDVALVASGGVSLGAYQAGVSYVLARALSDPAIRDRHLPGHHLNIATGASAGNINAFLTALIACDRLPHTVTATANPFFDAWINIGLDKLTPSTADPEAYRALFARDVGSDDYRAAAREVMAGTAGRARLFGAQDGLLTRAAFNAIERHLELRLKGHRYRADCSFLAGVTVTRAQAQPLAIDPEYAVPTQRYVAPLALHGRADGGLDVTNAALPTTTLGKRLALPTSAHRTIAADPILDLVEASSAFPVAFAPVKLRFCDATTVLGVQPECGAAAESARFTDGGVFDNVPLGMAIELGTSPDALYLYVDPDLRRGGLGGAPQLDEPAGLERLAGVFGAALVEARRYELQGIARYRPREVLPGRFRTSTRFYEVLGESAGSFGAFMHRDLRLYDYWVGTYDGLVMLAELACRDDAACATSKLVELAYALLPERARLDAADVTQPAIEAQPAAFVLHLAARELLLRGRLEARVALCQRVVGRDLICDGRAAPGDSVWAIHAALAARDAARRRDAGRGAALSAPLTIADMFDGVKLTAAVGSEARAPFESWLAETVDRVIGRALEVEDQDEARVGGALDNRLLGRAFPRWLAPGRVLTAHILRRPDASVFTLGSPGLSGADAAWPKLFHLFPRYVAWDARYGGFQLGWEPQLHLARWLHVPLGLVLVTRALDDEAVTFAGRVSSGIGIDVPSVVIPRLQLLAFGEQPFLPAGVDRRGGVELAVTIAHVLRVAVGAYVFGERYADDPLASTYVTIGVQEISAILYTVTSAVLGL